MSASDGNAPGSSKGSLLSMAPSPPRRAPEQPARSLLSVVGEEDARELHARRREARKAAAASTVLKADPKPDAETISARLMARAASLRGRKPAAPAQPAAAIPADAHAASTQVPILRPAVQREESRSDEFSSGNPYWQPLVDPVRVISGIMQSKRLILATTILGGMLGVAVALSTAKTYESTTELLVDPRNLNIVDREITQAGLPSDATLAIVENQVRVMESGIVIDKVVERLSLPADPEFNGEAGGFSLTGLVGELRALLISSDGGDVVIRRQATAVSNLYKALNIERGSKTFVISIGAKTREAEKSALIANTVAEVFLDTYGELQSGSAGRATQELTGRLDELRKAVEAAERKVEAFKAQNEIIDPQGRLITDDEIVKLNEQLSVARARTFELDARAQSARSVDVSDVLDGTLPEQATSGLITELRSQYASLKQESDRLAVRLGPRHPQRQAVEAQLAGAREQIQNELRRLNAGIQIDLKRAVQLEQDLAARLAQLKVQKGSLSSELVTLRELERDATSKRSVYESYLLRARETGEQQSLNTANVSVISKANPALRPTGPSRSMISIAFTLLGFAAGVGLGAARGAVGSYQDNSGRRRVADHPDRVPSPTIPTPPRPEADATKNTSENDMMHLVKSDRRDRPEPAQTNAQHAPYYDQQARDWQAREQQSYEQQARDQQGWRQPYPGMPEHGMNQPAMNQPMHPPYGHGQPAAAPSPYPGQYAGQLPAHHPAQYQPPQPQAPQGWQSQPQPMPHPQVSSQHNGAPQGYPYAPPPVQQWQPTMQQWQPPQQFDPYGHQPQPAMQSQPHLSVVETRAEPEPERSPIDEIRDSLREVREAIRELAENRKRRYF